MSVSLGRHCGGEKGAEVLRTEAGESDGGVEGKERKGMEG